MNTGPSVIPPGYRLTVGPDGAQVIADCRRHFCISRSQEIMRARRNLQEAVDLEQTTWLVHHITTALFLVA